MLRQPMPSCTLYDPHAHWPGHARALLSRDNFDALVEDMKQHPLPADEVSRVLFVRPASALGHMRHHPDSQSIASVVGLSINVVELPPQLQVWGVRPPVT